MSKKHIITEKIFHVVCLANYLMKKHKVEYYKFSFSDDKSCLGKCTHDTIFINYNYATDSDLEEIQQTILHEIAHAIAGIENGHNTYWKAVAKDIGLKDL